jgi:hypothetical protein
LNLHRLWTKLKSWMATRKIKSIAKCHQRAIPIWADWIGDRIVGVVVKRTSDPNYAHECYGTLVLSSRMDWKTATKHICRYMGCGEIPISLGQLRGSIEDEITMLKLICETVHSTALRKRKERRR